MPFASIKDFLKKRLVPNLNLFYVIDCDLSKYEVYILIKKYLKSILNE